MDFTLKNHLYIPTVSAIKRVMTCDSTASTDKVKIVLLASINYDAFWYGIQKCILVPLTHTEIDKRMNRLMMDNQAGWTI